MAWVVGMLGRDTDGSGIFWGWSGHDLLLDWTDGYFLPRTEVGFC